MLDAAQKAVIVSFLKKISMFRRRLVLPDNDPHRLHKIHLKRSERPVDERDAAAIQRIALMLRLKPNFITLPGQPVATKVDLLNKGLFTGGELLPMEQVDRFLDGDGTFNASWDLDALLASCQQEGFEVSYNTRTLSTAWDMEGIRRVRVVRPDSDAFTLDDYNLIREYFQKPNWRRQTFSWAPGWGHQEHIRGARALAFEPIRNNPSSSQAFQRAVQAMTEGGLRVIRFGFPVVHESFTLKEENFPPDQPINQSPVYQKWLAHTEGEINCIRWVVMALATMSPGPAKQGLSNLQIARWVQAQGKTIARSSMNTYISHIKHKQGWYGRFPLPGLKLESKRDDNGYVRRRFNVSTDYPQS